MQSRKSWIYLFPKYCLRNLILMHCSLSECLICRFNIVNRLHQNKYQFKHLSHKSFMKCYVKIECSLNEHFFNISFTNKWQLILNESENFCIFIYHYIIVSFIFILTPCKGKFSSKRHYKSPGGSDIFLLYTIFYIRANFQNVTAGLLVD